MRDDQKARVAAAFEKVMDVVAGDSVIWVDEEGTQTTTICIMEDLLVASTSATVQEGIETDQAGWRSGALRKLTFVKRYLAELEVTIDPSGHFLINSERWDLAENEPELEAIVPLAGIQSLLEIVVRKSVEVNNSTEGSDFTYGD